MQMIPQEHGGFQRNAKNLTWMQRIS